MPHSVIKCASAPSLMTHLPARSTTNESVSITETPSSAAAVLRPYRCAAGEPETRHSKRFRHVIVGARIKGLVVIGAPTAMPVPSASRGAERRTRCPEAEEDHHIRRVLSGGARSPAPVEAVMTW